jgi:hypothetical protein
MAHIIIHDMIQLDYVGFKRSRVTDHRILREDGGYLHWSVLHAKAWLAAQEFDLARVSFTHNHDVSIREMVEGIHISHSEKRGRSLTPNEVWELFRHLYAIYLVETEAIIA